MSALSRLITKCTKRQLQIAKTVDEISTIMDRTIAFAEAEKPYIGEDEINELLPYIPVTEPEPTPEPTESDSEPVTESGGMDAQDEVEAPAEGVSDGEGA